MTHNRALLVFAIIYTAAMLIGGKDDFELAKQQERTRQQNESYIAGMAGHAGRGDVSPEPVSTW